MENARRLHSIVVAVDGFVASGLVIATVYAAHRTYVHYGGVVALLNSRVTVLNVSLCIGFGLVWSRCLTMLRLYRNDLAELAAPLRKTGLWCVVAAGLLVFYLKGREIGDPSVFVIATVFGLAFLYEGCRLVLSHFRLRHRVELQQVVILGTGRRAGKAWRELRLHHEHDKCLLGFVDDIDPGRVPPDIAARYLGNVSELSTYLVKHVVDELIIAVPIRSCYDLAQRAVCIAEAAGVHVVCVNEAFSLVHAKRIRERASLFVDLVPRDSGQTIAQTAKRGFDIVIAASLLLFGFPLILIIAALVKVTSPGPVFFVQSRYGFRRRRFNMYKFRSMVQNAEHLQTSLETANEAQGPIFKIRNDPRMTPLGSFLRRSSLDELPQLWNVLSGEMSLVGPRPMSVRDVSLFSEAYLMRRFSVRPGITGIWQIAGRSSLSFDQWIRHDFSYIDEWSLALDLKILARTVPAVLRRSGAA
jgi:exopolysaccharide biosynthesis polyprenyl glycosylphosphotransferase